MTSHEVRLPQWPPATATYEYLAAYERTGRTTPGADQQVWQQVRTSGRSVLVEEPAAGIVVVGLSPEATQRLCPHDFDPDLTSADFDPITTLVTDRGWRCAQDSDALWDMVRCWPGLAGGAIPVVTGR